MHDRTAAELLALLEQERQAIRTASFDVLDALAEKKAEIFATVTQSGAEPGDLGRIQKGLAENQALLAAAIAGVKAAQTRIQALHDVRRELTVYDQSGQLARVTAARPGMEKKA